jgi:glycosyltransferase involved in cell wall biosynthesis
MQTKISVVIPTYKRYDLLQRCLKALTDQSLDKSEYEVLIVSDGYDAATEQIVKALSLYNFRYLFLPHKKGPAAARNLGWQKAQSRLIAFTDDDTIPHFNWLSSFLANSHETLAEAFTGKVKVPRPDEPTDYEMNIAHLEHADFVTANCACTRTALEITGGFDERFSMAWREDSDLEFKLLQQGVPIYHIPEALVIHPVRKAKWGISISDQKKSMFNALLYKKYPRLYRERIRPTPNWRYYIMVLSFFLLFPAWITESKILLLASLLCFLILWTDFTLRRLRYTSKSRTHVVEMIVTSVVIPFVAVYWHLYGSYRYKVLFL